MPVVSYSYRQQRIRLLYRATWKHIAENGVHHVTLDAVLKSSGLTTGTLYSYFRSRDELVSQATAAALDELGLVVSRALTAPADSPADLMTNIIDSFAEAATDEPWAMSAASAVIGSRPPRQAPDPSLLALYDESRARLERLVRQWQTDGTVTASATPPAVVDLLISTMLGYFVQASFGAGLTPMTQIAFVDALLKGPEASAASR